VLQIVAIVLFFQGISIAVLSSHFGPAIGVVSISLGVLILVVFPPESVQEGAISRTTSKSGGEVYGIRLIDYLFERAGRTTGATILGASLIVITLIHNAYISNQPGIGDLDTLSMALGGLIMVYPFVLGRFKVEICFALLFVALVVVILVVPQAILSLDDESSEGNWYVYYLLAAPFAGALNLLGIPSNADASNVMITFVDGSTHILSISTACAGLYSFSIFVSAFFSFVLVFERLPLRITVSVLSVGLLVAYLGNLLRMIVIGVIGYYYGIGALLWAHDNVGWMIFLSWSSVFWYAALRFADRRMETSSAVRETGL
jgi:archaeosortase C (PEF-CTERM variant)